MRHRKRLFIAMTAVLLILMALRARAVWTEAQVIPFQVAPELLNRSRFDFRAQGYQEGNGAEKGQPKYEQTLGGEAVWFYLRNFAATPKR